MEAAIQELMAADPLGVAPSHDMRVATLRTVAKKAWHQWERAPFLDALPYEVSALREICAMQKKGAHRRAWAAANARDLQAILDERHWNDRRMVVLTPGVTAASWQMQAFLRGMLHTL